MNVVIIGVHNLNVVGFGSGVGVEFIALIVGDMAIDQQTLSVTFPKDWLRVNRRIISIPVILNTKNQEF